MIDDEQFSEDKKSHRMLHFLRHRHTDDGDSSESKRKTKHHPMLHSPTRYAVESRSFSIHFYFHSTFFCFCSFGTLHLSIWSWPNYDWNSEREWYFREVETVDLEVVWNSPTSHAQFTMQRLATASRTSRQLSFLFMLFTFCTRSRLTILWTFPSPWISLVSGKEEQPVQRLLCCAWCGCAPGRRRRRLWTWRPRPLCWFPVVLAKTEEAVSMSLALRTRYRPFRVHSRIRHLRRPICLSSTT